MLLTIPPRSASRARLIPGLSLRAGDVLAGRFRIMSLLRADRTCAHVAAVQITSNTRVDVQILLAMDDGIEHVHLRFLAEARRAAALDHAHVDRVLHVGVTPDGHPFVVREPSEGKTVSALLDEVGSLPTESAVDIALALCEVLEQAHAQGLVHGALDATAVRLCWTVDGPSNVKLAELGTSRALGMLSADARALVSLVLRAPELLQGDREVDARADVWGVGVLLYTMLAGAPPFAVESPSQVNLSLVLDEPAMLAGVPDGLAEIVDACLAKDPTARPPSAAALRAKLRPFGTRPVFEKSSSVFVVDTEPYDALVLEQLVEEAAAAAAAAVAPEPLVAKPSPPPATVAASSTPSPEPVLALVKQVAAPAPRLAPSVPPVSLTLRPPPASRPSSPGSRRKIVRRASGIMALAAFVALAVSMRGTIAASFADDEPRAAARSEVPQPVTAPIVERKAAPEGSAEPAADAPTMTVTQPAAVPPPPVPATASGSAPPLAASASAKPRPPAPPAALPTALPKAHAEPVAPVDPIVHAPAAPIQPQPKASEDDLRRFLDDRR